MKNENIQSLVVNISYIFYGFSLKLASVPYFFLFQKKAINLVKTLKIVCD